jgi:hypothetical protein
MKEMIRNIFNEHSFIYSQIEAGDLYIKENDTIKYYWLIVEIDDLSVVLDKQDEWFDESKRKIEDQNFDKNVSLLILIKRGNLDTTDIIRIEEDPFQFKKMVLTYTDESLEELKTKSDGGTNQALRSLIVNESVFHNYKENYGDYSWMNLLYDLASKIPFLEIDVMPNQSLTDLLTKCNQLLEATELKSLSEAIEEKFPENILSNLDNMEADDLIQIFNIEGNGN